MDRAYSRAWALLRLLDLLEGVAEVLGVVEVEEGLGDSKDMRSKAPAAVVEEEGAIGIRETLEVLSAGLASLGCRRPDFGWGVPRAVLVSGSGVPAVNLTATPSTSATPSGRSTKRNIAQALE